MSWRSQERQCRHWTGLGVTFIVFLFLIRVFMVGSSEGGGNGSSSATTHRHPRGAAVVLGGQLQEGASSGSKVFLPSSSPWPSGSIMSKAFDVSAGGNEDEEVAATTNILFIGDSITRGMAQKDKREKKAFKRNKSRPDGGLCSYRHSLYSDLVAKNRKLTAESQSKSGDVVLRFVGPEARPHGGPYPDRCGGSEEVSLFGPSAATWGISLEQVLDNTYKISSPAAPALPVPEVTARDAPLRENTTLIYSSPPFLRGRVAVGSATFQFQRAPEVPHQVMQGEKIYSWITSYRPSLVFIAIGTNDLALMKEADPDESAAFRMLHQRLVPALRQVLRAGADAAKERNLRKQHVKEAARQKVMGTTRKGTSSLPSVAPKCPLIVAIAPLLPRSDDTKMRSRVHRYNLLLAKQKKLAQDVCGWGENSAANKVGRGGVVERHDLQHPDFNVLFCSQCLQILDPLPDSIGLNQIGAGGINSEASEFLYDGLHPNAKGEVVLGKAYAAQLLEEV